MVLNCSLRLVASGQGVLPCLTIRTRSVEVSLGVSSRPRPVPILLAIDCSVASACPACDAATFILCTLTDTAKDAKARSVPSCLKSKQGSLRQETLLL